MTNLEININVHAPELAAAIAKLADALPGKAVVTTMPNQPATAPAPGLSPAARAMQQLPATAPTPAPAAAVQQTAAPVQQPIPAMTAPVPVQQSAPVAVQPTYTIGKIGDVAGERVRAGKRPELLALLDKYGIGGLNQLRPEQYDAFAADLRAIGGNI